MDKINLNGQWKMNTSLSTGKQFGFFEKQEGEFNCWFLQDEKSNNYFIYQLLDGRYIDSYMTQGFLNLSDPISNFDPKTTLFKFKSNVFI